MASATEVREWAISEGKAKGRGKLGQSVIGDWNTDHPNDPYEPGEPRGGFTGNTPDYPGDDFDANFPDPPEGGDGLGDTGETPPRRPRSSKSAPKGGWNPFNRDRKKKTGAKKRPPRVSTEDVWGAVWRGGARLLTSLPPLQRTLRMQAPVAGMLMDDVTKATVIDPLLQPIARLVDQGKTVQALAGPPVFVTAIMLHQQQRASMDPPQEPNPLFMSIAVEGLRSSLMAWMDVAGPKFEQALTREKEFEEKYGQTVDDTMAFIFAAPVDPSDMGAVMAEEEAIKRAQGIL
jgi:hypothetical protein